MILKEDERRLVTRIVVRRLALEAAASVPWHGRDLGGLAGAPRIHVGKPPVSANPKTQSLEVSALRVRPPRTSEQPVGMGRYRMMDDGFG